MLVVASSYCSVTNKHISALYNCYNRLEQTQNTLKTAEGNSFPMHKRLVYDLSMATEMFALLLAVWRRTEIRLTEDYFPLLQQQDCLWEARRNLGVLSVWQCNSFFVLLAFIDFLRSLGGSKNNRAAISTMWLFSAGTHLTMWRKHELLLL